VTDDSRASEYDPGVMKKRLFRTGNSVMLELEASDLEMLGIDESTEVDVTIEDGVMVVRTVADEESFKRATDEVNRRHEGLFRRLSK
jgi:antitoxin component of MazEF toxin-antitoxin module